MVMSAATLRVSVRTDRGGLRLPLTHPTQLVGWVEPLRNPSQVAVVVIGFASAFELRRTGPPTRLTSYLHEPRAFALHFLASRER
jgi:hypothetical protein